MSTLARVRVPARTFVLGKTLSAIPDLRVEIQPIVPYDPENRILLLWMACSDFDALRQHLEADGSVRGVTLAAAFDDRREWLFRAELATDPASLPLLATTDATVLAACSRYATCSWDVRVFAVDRRALSRAYEACRDRGIDVHIDWMLEVSELDRRGGTDLTPGQYEALTVAYRLGYYDIPRRVSAEEVAEVLDVSHQALSERLCRGHRNLVAALLRYEEASWLSDPFSGRLRFDSG